MLNTNSVCLPFDSIDLEDVHSSCFFLCVLAKFYAKCIRVDRGVKILLAL